MENDPWKAELAPVDNGQAERAHGIQLKSKYTLQTAYSRADNDAELNPMLVDAFTTRQRFPWTKPRSSPPKSPTKTRSA